MDTDKRYRKNILEWLVFGFSLLLTLSVIVYLSYQTYTYQEAPPDIRVEYRLEPGPASPYRYHVTVRNKGGETAEEVVIELLLKKGDTVLERSELQLPFVPQTSIRESWVSFTTDPATADSVAVKVVSFKKP